MSLRLSGQALEDIFALDILLQRKQTTSGTLCCTRSHNHAPVLPLSASFHTSVLLRAVTSFRSNHFHPDRCSRRAAGPSFTLGVTLVGAASPGLAPEKLPNQSLSHGGYLPVIPTGVSDTRVQHCLESCETSSLPSNNISATRASLLGDWSCSPET